MPEQVGIFGVGTAGGVGSEMGIIQDDASPGAKNVMNVLYPQLVKGYEILQQRRSGERPHPRKIGIGRRAVQSGGYSWF